MNISVKCCDQDDRIAETYLLSGAELEIYTVKEDELSIPNNAYITVSFGLNLSTCKELDTVFKVAVKTKTSNNLTEEDGRVELTRDKCTVTIEEHVTCTGRVGVAELFRQVNTSHAAIEWTMVWTEGGSLRHLRKLLSLYVFGKTPILKYKDNNATAKHFPECTLQRVRQVSMFYVHLFTSSSSLQVLIIVRPQHRIFFCILVLVQVAKNPSVAISQNVKIFFPSNWFSS